MSDQPNGAVPTADVLAMFQDAVKEKLHALVALDGATGSGKTWTALQLARILAGPEGTIAFIDTENRTALHYAAAPGEKIQRVNFWDPPYVFKHMPWRPPYDPAKLTEIVKALQGRVDVIVLDSLTHFWTGEGGTLDIVDAAASRASGNSFVGWKEGSPIQRHMLDTFIHASCHLIITMRSKMEYVIEEVLIPGRNGAKDRTVKQPRKIGLSPEQRAGIEYEFNVVADMDLEHKLVISKTRCSLLADRVAPKGRSAEVWQDYTAWLDIGIAMPSTADVDVLRERLNNLAPPEGQTIRQAFRERFTTKLDRMTLDEFTAAEAWLAEQAPPSVGPQDPSGADGAAEPVAPVSDGSRRLSGPPIPSVSDAVLPVPDGIAPEDEAYGDRIVRYVDLLPKPTLVEMATARGLPADDKVDVLRARISVALVTENHSAPTDDVLAKLEVAASRTRSTAAARG